MRETLRVLASEGMVEATNQRGFRVTSATEDDLRGILLMRIEIEAPGVKRSLARGNVAWESRLVAAFQAGLTSSAGLVGPSGCGKSTLLRLIGGLERASSGRVLQLGTPPEGCLNPLTYIFQDFALLPWRTVRGNISLVLEDHGIRGAAANKIITDVLARTKLSDFSNALPRQLSGGMKQRVAISRALAVNPAVMLMDEPLSALDSQTRELLMDDLVGLWIRQPFTAIYVTHNLAEAVRLGHRIVVLSRRPGETREIVEIDKALEDRAHADPKMERIQRHLWDLMREEARAADEELINV